jgi:malate dehydrogenase (oxaloacetate-decarboxylating)(NADP+)
VVNGAGASAISCCNHYVRAGVKKENIYMFDSKGCITKDRTDLNKYKDGFAQEKGYPSLEAAFKDADVFIGLSIGGVVQKEWVKTMAPNPIIFAMANPDPEIMYDDAVSVRKDLIMATGRSDYPNQVNNVLGFPFIFRGALDVRATAINDEMKMAATLALAKLAKEKVPEMVMKAYGGEEFEFGKEYIIPKPFDPRVLWYVAPAVAKAAIETGVAKVKEMNWAVYEEQLKERLGLSKEIIRVMIHKAQKGPKKVVYPEGEEENIIRAANAVYNDGIALPILIGNEKIIKKEIERIGFDLSEFTIVDPETCGKSIDYANAFLLKRQRKGATLVDAKNLIKEPNYFGSMMVELGEADAMISGQTTSYPNTIRPALQCVGIREGFKIVSGMYIVMVKNETYFFADCTVNINPNANQLAEIAISVADAVKKFEVVPKIGMLSFSNFGSASYPESDKVKDAVNIVRQKRPDLKIDGEMQADTAVVPDILDKIFPFNEIKGGANVLIFPNLDASNIAYKLMARIGQATVIGPILVGMNKPIHVLQRGATVDDIINMTAIAVVEAEQTKN